MASSVLIKLLSTRVLHWWSKRI